MGVSFAIIALLQYLACGLLMYVWRHELNSRKDASLASLGISYTILDL